MTDADIIKALECCSKLGCSNEETADCPLKPCDECITKLSAIAIDLIKRQKAEIERLKLITTNKPYCVSIGTADIFTENHEEYEWLLAKISAEAIKEFAERLKETFPQDDFLRSTKRISKDIDNLVKEMVGDTE